VLLGCIVCWIAAAAPAPQKKTQSPPAKTSPAPKKKRPAKKPAATAKKSTTVHKKSASRKRVPSWRSGQQTPTRERYLEIQQALVSRGFLEGPPTGLWGTDSVAALKKFQASQSLEASGKLDAITLIALGLGPKRGANGAVPRPSPFGEARTP
jgi:peptidoglycan hydrolase-like protein with peptidoglycan-binding domain